MKYIYILAIQILLFTSCKAQTPVLPLYRGDFGDVTNAYYKDLDNDFNKFIGTWKYRNGNTSLLIKLEKRVMQYDDENHIYLDFLAGECQYIENGIEKLNTLTHLSNPNLKLYKNTISGWLITYPCKDCPANEREVALSYTEQDRKYIFRDFRIRHYTVNGQEFLQINHQSGGVSMIPPDAPNNAPLGTVLPLGTYILQKQP